MQQNNAAVLDYHLIPRERVPHGRLTFRRTAKGQLDRYRHPSQGALADVILRMVDSRREQRRWRVAKW